MKKPYVLLINGSVVSVSAEDWRALERPPASALTQVCVVWHQRDPDDDETAKCVGVFSTRESAQLAIDYLRLQSGFADYPDAFIVDPYTVDQVWWPDGFVSV